MMIMTIIIIIIIGVHRAVHHNIISIVKPTRCTNVSNLYYFGMTLYMYRYCCLLASKQTAVSVWSLYVQS